MTMKKYLFTMLAVLLMLGRQAGTAAAASASITLISVENGYQGPVFTFRVSGEFSKAELKGFLHVENGVDYNLYCKQIDDITVKCTTSDKVSGVNVVVTWGGSTFWTSVPKAPPVYCYEVYDWNLTEPFVQWVNYGTYCQNSPANYGDMIIWYNPGWEDTFPYLFLSESPAAEWCSFSPHPGDAYYFPLCPPSIPL
jgi:hypothetical protein